MKLDLLAFAAHPDDVEFTSAGTMILMARKGYSTGIIDLTKGELGTRGDAKSRLREAAVTAKLMGLKVRKNLGMPDGNIEISQTNVRKVISILREYRPRIVICPYGVDRHPDHADASILIRRAVFYSGLKKITTRMNGRSQEPHRPELVLQYRNTTVMPPSIVVDVTSVFKEKMETARAFVSQLHDPSNREPDTFISRPEFFDILEARSREYGFLVGAKFGEAFYLAEPVWNNDLFTLLPPEGRMV
jgi:bacillithiol biosynthesis deacetylase BshB1